MNANTEMDAAEASVSSADQRRRAPLWITSSHDTFDIAV
jgi:hypothetical protein